MHAPNAPLPVEQFPALAGTATIHGFVGRVAGVDVNAERTEVLERLDGAHQAARRLLRLGDRIFATGEQVHGNRVAVLGSTQDEIFFPCEGVDGLITDRTDLCLGIYVADCCAVYLVDPVRRVCGLIHSGKKGTGLGIVPTAIAVMGERFGSHPENVIAQLGPCIRPPWYEVDFGAQIAAQCRAAGVVQVVDGGACTAANPALYYSYRREKGRTGRMLALLALA